MKSIPPDVHQNPNANDNQCPTLRDKLIRSDERGRVCLNDIWSLAGGDKSRRPAHWRRSSVCKRLENALADRIVQNSHISDRPDLIDSTRGTKGLTFAHIVLAQAYAEYLDSDLAVEVREVFLRYRAADASLADDILDRASLEDNRHTVARALGRVTRGRFTDVLKDHGVRQPWYGICTDAVYRPLLGDGAAGLKQALGLPKSASLRDVMTTTQLAAVALAESFSADRIQAKECRGGPRCREETAAAASTVRLAMETEARSRRAVVSPANENTKPISAA